MKIFVRWNRIGALAAALALGALALSGCTEGPGAAIINLNKTPDDAVYTGSPGPGGGSGGPPSAIPVASVTFPPQNLTVDPGDTIQLTVTVLPANATDRTVVWSSADEGNAKVDPVTGVGGGDVTITATAGGESATCTVVVN